MSAFAHPSNTKLNAAGLTPDHSLVLPERGPQPDEVEILKALSELYALQPAETSFALFAPNVVFTMPTGDVTVGAQGLRGKFQSTGTRRQVHQRLLTTPDALPARTMCVDQVVSEDGEPSRSVRSLLVLKRRAADGLVTSLTEEEGHRRATAPLAARAAAASNFYSPTDNMLSPCTSKLNLAKKKHHLKGKPMTLFASQLAAANSSGPASSKQPGSNTTNMDMDM
ncbi:hypothetical protein FA10DRAFT_264280 [Acaromyces ingoldii]|uniref:Uncharacterized protein n=1 Tax=Acaromyces ingoldii TaxID=215250 RepID=A0A316YYE8_9BASI|nr:hypothetical protein FA10DRAFT_264280 [Acaromyces ingoldii]PWN93658.1 hypothetical protein FA10DRAFT_264280 [Acaromyces ingoldii]